MFQLKLKKDEHDFPEYNSEILDNNNGINNFAVTIFTLLLAPEDACTTTRVEKFPIPVGV